MESGLRWLWGFQRLVPLMIEMTKAAPHGKAEVQLHKIDSDKYAFIMPAAPVIVIATFTDGTIITGVNSLNADSASGGARYNLMGQPVDDNYKGIVIQNGTKKVIR